MIFWQYSAKDNENHDLIYHQSLATEAVIEYDNLMVIARRITNICFWHHEKVSVIIAPFQSPGPG